MLEAQSWNGNPNRVDLEENGLCANCDRFQRRPLLSTHEESSQEIHSSQLFSICWGRLISRYKANSRVWNRWGTAATSPVQTLEQWPKVNGQMDAWSTRAVPSTPAAGCSKYVALLPKVAKSSKILLPQPSIYWVSAASGTVLTLDTEGNGHFIRVGMQLDHHMITTWFLGRSPFNSFVRGNFPFFNSHNVKMQNTSHLEPHEYSWCFLSNFLPSPSLSTVPPVLSIPPTPPPNSLLQDSAPQKTASSPLDLPGNEVETLGHWPSHCDAFLSGAVSYSPLGKEGFHL